MARRQTEVVEEEEEVLSAEELSKYIKQVSIATKKLLNNGHLSKRAILLLIHDALPTTTRRGSYRKVCTKAELEMVLDTIVELRETYCP